MTPEFVASLERARMDYEALGKERDKLQARVAELEQTSADLRNSLTCSREEVVRYLGMIAELEAKYAGIEQMLSLYSSPPGAKLVDVLAGALARGLNAADERDQLKAKLAESSEGFLRKLHERNEEKLELEKKLAAMPEPVVIDLELASHVLTAFKQAHADSPYLSMLSALRGVLGERVVVSGADKQYARDAQQAREERESVEQALSECEKRAEKAERELAELRAENERLKESLERMTRMANDKARELKAIENRCCSDRDYGHEGVHPVEVRIQTQQKRIVELQRKLEESEAARKADEAKEKELSDYFAQMMIREAKLGDKCSRHSYDNGRHRGAESAYEHVLEMMHADDKRQASETPRIVAMTGMSAQEMDARLEALARKVNGPQKLNGLHQATVSIPGFKPVAVNLVDGTNVEPIKLEPIEPSVPYGWEHASPADKLRPNERNALRQVEPNPKAERLKERLDSAHGLVESLQSELRSLRGAMDVFTSKLGRRADERVHNGG